MNIENLISKDTVNFSLKGNNRKEIIEELAKLLYDNGCINNYDGFVKDIIDRENKVSTGIGRQIAIPHAISKNVSKTFIAFGKCDKGIDFSSIDGKTCRVFLMIAVSNENSDEHIKIISHIARKIAHSEIVKGFLEAESFDELLKLLS